MPSKIYFTKVISPHSLVNLYEILGKKLKGKVAIKLHSGEAGNKNYLRPSFVEEIISLLDGTVVECNTAYEGARDTSEKHKKLLKDHGWSTHFKVDLLDEEGPDVKFEMPYGKQIKENYVGKHLLNYDSMLVISHFKGHAMGGYGGALKQLSIGCASSYGKKFIHGAGDANMDMFKTNQAKFITSMGDAATSVHKHFKGRIIYINCMVNISIDCDCDANAHAPCMKDIGLLISEDPVAIDQACLDIIYNSKDPGKKQLIERIESRLGHLIIETAEADGCGSSNYELIDID